MANTPEGKKQEKAFSVKGHPSFVLTNSSGEVIDRWVGYGKPDKWVKTFNDAAADPTTFEQKRKRFTTTPTAKDAATLARIHGTRGEREDALKLYRRAFELDPAGPYQQPIFDNLHALHFEKDSKITSKEVKDAANAALSSPQATVENKMNLAFRMLALEKRKGGDTKLTAPYVDAALEASKDDKDMASARDRLLVDQALLVTGDTARAVELKKKGMPEGWMKDAEQLNEFAWWSFENKVNLEEAEALARKGVELSGPGATRAQILDTVAEICALRGPCPEAVDLIRQAIKEDPDEEHYPKQLERFQKLTPGQG